MKRSKGIKSSISINQSYEGETIEAKVRRITTNKEPISDSAPLIYTERKDGVLPGYDIRTDRFDIALEATDKITKAHKAKRDERHKPKEDNTKGDTKGGQVGNSGVSTPPAGPITPK